MTDLPKTGTAPDSNGGLWPLWIAIAFPLYLILVNTIPFGFLLAILGLLFLSPLWAGAGIWALVLSLRHIWRHQWSRATRTAILPIVVLIAGFNFWGFVHLTNDCADVLHFAVRRATYMRKIEQMPSNGEPRLVVVNFGGMIWASRGVVYDESDEIMLDPSKQSFRWKTQAEQSELACGYFARPIPGPAFFSRHWYLASFPC